MELVTERELVRAIPDWAVQLATLTRTAWTGSDGVCRFPYRPLVSAKFWRESVAREWDAGRMRSWAMADRGRIVAHAALVERADGDRELGRWVAYPDAPRGTMTRLADTSLVAARAAGGRPVRVECTQAHLFSQRICERLGLRPAGFGILERSADGTWWDILHYDDAPLSPFDPDAFDDPLVIGNPLGTPVRASRGDLERLRAIAGLISTDPGGDLPPQRFHILPHRADVLTRTLARVLSSPPA